MEKEVWSVDICEDGIVRILHVCGCRGCNSWGYARVNMAYVDENDYIHTAQCPQCHQEEVYLITYALLDEFRREEEDDDSREI
jgi:hypothetical protein